MKLFGKILIASVASFGAGAGSMYLFMRARNKAKIDKKVEEINDFYVKKYVKKDVDKAENAISESKNDLENQIKKDVSTLDEVYKIEPNNHALDYHNMYKKTNFDSRFEKDIGKDITSGSPEFPEFTLRRELSKWPNYEYVVLTYYEKDGLFVNVDDSVNFDYSEDFFGLDNLGMFGVVGDPSDSADVIYLRDDRTQTMYELHYEGLATYEEAVGLDARMTP